ncbi:chitin-inducible gibberellin-responsive protein 1-like [Tripterygium wilfordii]|uniref:chitin-inducible gibberellin-responsive protein 1-like n=1 Tax=Tripterygium wilfordii TaxID=458696 RepID=UPI0018F8155A|nr:chitin-inducible gibberellin-responsive protein 1-like [Tripterygium wilfordii]
MMDSHQHFRYSVAGVGVSYSSSHPAAPSIPNRFFDSLKFEIGNSPNSPFSTQFDCDTITALSDSQERNSSTENISGVSPHSSSLNSNGFFHWPSPSVECRGDSLPYLFSGTSFSPDTSSSRNIKHALQELETALMSPDDDDEVTTSNTSFQQYKGEHTSGQRTRALSQERQVSRVIQPQTSFVSRQRQSEEGARIEKRQKAVQETSMHSVPPGNLKQLLISCAKALSDNNMSEFDTLVERARRAVSITGEPIQRLGAYMVEGLVARKEKSGTNIYHTLRCREPESKDLLSYMQILYEICPYLKFGYMAANGAIAEACRNEDRIHIIDFQIAQGTQWMTLLQALAARPSGPPHVRITGIDDPVSRYARGDGLEAVGRRLALISQKFNIPVEFHSVPVFAPDITRDMLDVRPGEALAVNFPLQLHHTPDESVDVNNPRDGLLRMVRSLNPKVTTLVEQESNTNTTPFLTRFKETQEYYLAMFESIDVTLPRDGKERINVEQHCLARDIVNVISCEGKERVERHELFGKWKSRLTMAGFRQYPLSWYVNSVIRSLLRFYSEHYTLVEKDGAMLLGWKDRMLISASAWR